MDFPSAFDPRSLFFLGLALVLAMSLHSLLLWLGNRREPGLGHVLAAAGLQGLGLLAQLARPWRGGAPLPVELVLLLGAGYGLWALRRYAGYPQRMNRWAWTALGAWALVALAFQAMGFAWVRGLAAPAGLVVLTLGLSRQLGLLAWEGVDRSLARVCAGLAVLLAAAALGAGAVGGEGYPAATRAWFGLGVLGVHQCLVLLLAQVQGQRVRARLERLVAVDPVTGLASAQGFRRRLDRAVGRSLRTGRISSVLILDLDDFEAMLAQHGPAPMARILEAFAVTLDRTLRESDRCGRLGGCRFAALLHHTQPMDALLAAERVRETWANLPLTLGGSGFLPTLSGGVASTGEPVADARELLALAEARAASARRGGGNNVESA